MSGYDRDDLAFFERFTLEPVAPAEIDERLDSGKRLSTLDIPASLDRQMVVESGAGVALYRLIQLFGTPNVPELVAGADQREREMTTWQYLFRVGFDREDEPATRDEIDREDTEVPEEFLLSIYDYKTNVSAGLSAWDSQGIGIREPTTDAAACPTLSVPPEEFLIGIVQLVLNMTEEPVPATFKELWV